MFKKRYLILGAAVPFMMLNGCSIGESQENKSVPIEKVDMSRYQRQTAEGVFSGILNTKFVDIIINNKLTTYVLTDNAIEQTKDLTPGDKVKYVFALNEKTGQNEVYSIAQASQTLDTTNLEEDKPVKNKLVTEEKTENKDEIEKTEKKKENDNVERVNLEVDYPSSTKDVKAIQSSFIEGTFKAIDTYDWNGDNLKKPGTTITFTKIEDTIEDDIQRERWRAAGILKKIGELQEGENTKLGDVRFVFYAETSKKYKEIMVIKNKYGYLRIETTTSKKNKEKAIAEVSAMLNSVE